MPSSFTAFIILKLAFASGSETTYIVEPFFDFFAARASSRVHCLKYARRSSTTKHPTSRPLRLSWVSHAFFKVSMSVVSAWATLSMLGQSQFSITSQSVLFSCGAKGSKPCAIGFTISPGLVFTNNFRPSRCVNSKVNPQSASTKEILRSMNKSAPLRLNTECSCCLRTKTTSPASASGCSSAISRNVTLWLSGEPFWMCTSNTSRSVFVWKLLPFPPQAPHCDCICWIIGPMRTTSMRTPRPSHCLHSCMPFFLSMTDRVIAIFLVAPLYICSKVTFNGCTTSFVFCRLRAPPPPPRRPPPPNNDSKMSDGSPGPPPSSKPSSPKRSYLDRLSASLNTS
mmetsp:Transcript_66951/g.193881  ORF Transcript_66951/g.193881 Transcript_66951/m.193881 type:complete len:340 (-) Transcript_66951:58-1077(-)